MIRARGTLLGVLVVALACKPSPPAGFDAAAASAFQRSLADDLAGDASPFSVVDAFYLGPGETMRLVRIDRRVRATHEDADDAIELAVRDRFECVKRCDGHEGPIEASVVVPFGALRLELAPQPVGEGPGGRVLAHDPEAPALAAFRDACAKQGPGCLQWFPVSERWIVVAQWHPGADDPVELTTSRGLQKRFVAAGELRFELDGREHALLAYRSEGASASDPMLVPFCDATTGDTTYPVGRYLQVVPDGERAVIDFNRATNPWCAYSPHYNCPVPPERNRLELAVEAGERSFHP